MNKWKEINPDNFNSNFYNITIETIEKWEKVLVNAKTEFTKLQGNNLDLDEMTKEFQNRKEIKNDCDRSRIFDRPNLPDFGVLLEKLLILYCKINNVPYKQGMNEIMGPLILLKANFNISNSRIFNLFSCFLDNFLTNYYYEIELYAFRSSVSLLSLLLRYHDPTLFKIFEHAGICPQMYATNWLLTTFANKLSLGIVYKLWDVLIDENDQLFIHFIVIAFLETKRYLFINVDSSAILQSFSKIRIDTVSELINIIALAKKFRVTTPYSFRILVQKLEIFKPRSKRLKELYTKFNTDEMITLPLLPTELLYLLYNEQINCPDSQCQKYFRNPQPGVISIMSQEEECYYCKVLDAKNKKRFYIIDLRILKKEEEYFNEGNLPIANFLIREDLINGDVTELIDSQLSEYKGKAHIILITNDTTYFPKYEERYYDNKYSFNILFNTILGKSLKVEKEINEKKVKGLKDKLHKRYKLKEYDHIKKIISNLQEKDYPYVSYLYGGFKEVHELSLKYSINLTNHHGDKCRFCEKNKSKNEKINLFYQLYGGGARSNSGTLSNQTITNVSSSSNDIRSNINASENKSEGIEIINSLKNDDENTPPSEPDRYHEPFIYLEVNKMNDYIKDTSNKVFHCLLMKHNRYKYKDKIIMVINHDSVRIYQMFINSKSNAEAKVSFGMLDLIRVSNVKKYTRNKNVFDMKYEWKDQKDDNEFKDRKMENINIDLFTDIDGENFEKELQRIIMDNKQKSK